jgi:hypothetical protein
MSTALVVGMVLAFFTSLAPAAAQSLFVNQGDRAIDVNVAWSVGPFSNGVETHASGSLDGRWDVGVGFNRYAADFGGEDDTTLTEWGPSASYFLFKEQDDATPVSVAAHAALFFDTFEGGDEGWYGLTGGQLFKRFRLTDTFALYPYVGFFLAIESLAFGGAEAEYSLYLTRRFGVHGMKALGANAWLRITAEEHAFRRETYRAARVAFVRRF